MLAILGRDSLLPEADGTLWWDSVLEDSGEHAVGVSKDLREGIRSSIEIIANDVLQRRNAQGLPLEEIDAQDLARQSLRFLYRILFLLFAEARPDMGLVPAGADEYEEGYGLARLRELVLVDMASISTQKGTHLYDSLAVLFDLVRKGHRPAETADANPSLRFNALEADLFSHGATKTIDEVGLSNRATQRMLQHLLLTPEGTGDRGFISYAELGVNQLGAVYEGLMSYTGFFADEDLYEVAPKGDTTKGSWTVPASRADRLDLSPDDFVLDADMVTGERRTRFHPAGSFVFRLAGRERQQSASYYTPEVLTRFVVSQALEELLDQNGKRTSAEEILQLTVCEPALGSGAFAIEAVRQLATEYLTRRQEELDQQIPAEEMPAELAKVKAHIALHQVYGVDLNATAVELAEVSLWLDTMVPGLDAPWFGLRLRRGNSLIGAQRATFRRDQVADKAKPHLSARPTARNLDDDRGGLNGSVYHFLLPHEGWGAATSAKKSARDLAPEATENLKAWQRDVRKRLTSSPNAMSWEKFKQVEHLQDLSERVEVLWDFVLERMQLAESEAQRDLHFFGNTLGPTGNNVSRAEIEDKLNDPSSAYQRLRRVMDAWCALWFWPLTETEVEPPSVDQWVDALARLLGRARKTQDYLVPSGSPWAALNAREDLDLRLNGAESIDRIVAAHPWLTVTERIAEEQGFFHWQLDFATVFQRGGFDLQVGNPPWVRPQASDSLILAEFDPWWELVDNPPRDEIAHRLDRTLSSKKAVNGYLSEHSITRATSLFLSSPGIYPHSFASATDLYRNFMESAWANTSFVGISGLLHPEGHLSDNKSTALRAASYSRFRRRWHFINQKKLFEDIGNTREYGVHIYGSPREPHFYMGSSMFHPSTIERSLWHDGTGEEPGLKTDDGDWNTAPHRNKIVEVTASTLLAWQKVIGSHGSPAETPTLYPVSKAGSKILEQLSQADRIGDFGLSYVRGWAESAEKARGTLLKVAKKPKDWQRVIAQGPHVSVSNPLFKQPNPELRSHRDWTEIDLEEVGANFRPQTAFQYSLPDDTSSTRFYNAYPKWGIANGPSTTEQLASRFYRLIWRERVDTNSVRALFPAILPPGATYMESLVGAAKPDDTRTTVLAAAVTSSLISDFWVRASNTGHADSAVINSLPACEPNHTLAPLLIQRSLRLNCLTDAYAPLWEELEGNVWTTLSPIRVAEFRRRAQVEIDAITALALGVTIDDLCVIYRTTFPVMKKYERIERFDLNGRIVPTAVVNLAKKRGEETGTSLTDEERTWTHSQSEVTYVAAPPFRQLDREADMREAYARFLPLLDANAEASA